MCHGLSAILVIDYHIIQPYISLQENFLWLMEAHRLSDVLGKKGDFAGKKCCGTMFSCLNQFPMQNCHFSYQIEIELFYLLLAFKSPDILLTRKSVL